MAGRNEGQEKDLNPPENATEIIKGKFYFQKYAVKDFLIRPQIHYISTKKNYVAKPLHGSYEFFPVMSMADIVVYCREIIDKLKELGLEQKILYHVTPKFSEELNGALFLVLTCGYRAERLTEYLVQKEVKKNHVFSKILLEYSKYDIYMDHFFAAVAKASHHGFLDIAKYNVEENDLMGREEHGNIHWVIPEKLFSFSCPQKDAKRKLLALKDAKPDIPAKDAKFYLQYFKGSNVSTLVRLVKESYSSSLFTDAGIDVVEIDFKREKLPSALQVTKFIATVSNAQGAVAVHCEAGLGRTGTMISLFLMENYHFSALEAIAWFRLLRAGNVTEAQQVFLVDHQSDHVSDLTLGDALRNVEADMEGQRNRYALRAYDDDGSGSVMPFESTSHYANPHGPHGHHHYAGKEANKLSSVADMVRKAFSPKSQMSVKRPR